MKTMEFESQYLNTPLPPNPFRPIAEEYHALCDAFDATTHPHNTAAMSGNSLKVLRELLHKYGITDHESKRELHRQIVLISKEKGAK